MLDIVRYLVIRLLISVCSMQPVAQNINNFIFGQERLLESIGNCILHEMDNDDDFTFCQPSLVLTFHLMKS